MLHQVQTAIIPEIPLSKVMNEWGEICSKLGENNRCRRPQINFFKNP